MRQTLFLNDCSRPNVRFFRILQGALRLKPVTDQFRDSNHLHPVHLISSAEDSREIFPCMKLKSTGTTNTRPSYSRNQPK
jgi:hypothetical protein